MDEEIDQVAIYLNTKRSLLCSAFVQACRRWPSKTWTDIEDAVEANEEIKRFDYYTEKYLGYVYDDAHYCMRRKIETIG